MNDVRVRLTTVLGITAIASAAAFALGRSTSTSSPTVSAPAPTIAQAEGDMPSGAGEMPPGHPKSTESLPPGHPPVDPNAAQAPPADTAAGSAESTLSWKVPPRWQVVPNTSSMRLATYRVPRAAGDSADADVSVSQAGGGIGANVDRWIGQFGEEGKRSAKQSTKKVAGLDVTIVEVSGTYAGMGDSNAKGSALLGAIVATPGMPHFFKITGPEKTVQSARQELDELLSSMSPK